MADHLEFKSPIVRVALADSRRRRYDIAAGDEGYLIYDELAQLSKQRKLDSTYFYPNNFAEFGNQATPHFIAIDRKKLQGLILRPCLRQPIPWTRNDGTPARRWGVVTVPNPTGGEWGSHAAGEVINDFWEWFSFWPNDADNWDFTLREDGLLYDMTQKVSFVNDGTDVSDWIVSRVSFLGSVVDPESTALGYHGLSPDPFFTVGFRRQGLPPQFGDLTDAGDPPDEPTTPPDNAGDASSGKAWTQIVWGVKVVADGFYGTAYPDGKWMLHCPVHGKPVLYENVQKPIPWSEGQPNWVRREWTEGDLNAVDAKKAAKDGYEYHIGTIGHAICVSEGGFDGNFAYYMVEGSDEPIVPPGPMLVRNWPGQFTCWIDLSLFPSPAYLARFPYVLPHMSDVVSFSEDNTYGIVYGQPYSQALRSSTSAWSIAGSLPDVAGNGAIIFGPTQMDGYEQLATYGMQVVPGSYPADADPTSEVVTQTTPFVEAVTIFQDPTLTDNGARTFTETTRAVLGLRSEAELEDRTAETQALVVDNRLELFTVPEGDVPTGGWSPTWDYRPGRQVQLQAVGWNMRNVTDGTDEEAVIALGDYWIVQPEKSRETGRFDLTDLLGICALAQWEGQTPLNFRNWDVAEALTFGFSLLGVGTAQLDLEDIGATVPNDEEHEWEIGTSWVKVFQGILDRGAAIWYDWADGKIKTGCRFCRTKRTAGNWQAHQDNGWNSSACLLADVARAGATGIDAVVVEAGQEATDAGTLLMVLEGSFKSSERILKEDDFANSITVVGKRPETEGGGDIIAHWPNPAALDPNYGVDLGDDYMGFPISKVVKDSNLTTDQAVYQRLAEIAERVATLPKYISFAIPLRKEMKPGMVVKVEGAKWSACHDQKFRVTAVRHNPDRGGAVTEIKARSMFALPAE